jgi:SAM-dependent MidA family methyltransferase
MTLREYIENEIRTQGLIPFSRYMELCLYGPSNDSAPVGYYTSPREKFGKQGDFYTSSDVHAVFGRLLARQFEEMWRVLDEPEQMALVELGPGRGLFAQDVLAWSKKMFPAFYSAVRYTLIEGSAGLRARLAELFAEDIHTGKVRIASALDEIVVASPFIFFGNEFFDALPVEVLDHRGQLHVAVDGSRFAETFVLPSPAVLDYVERFAVHPGKGERVDAPLIAQDYIRRIAALAAVSEQPGYFVFIDYGYTRDEQLAGRHRGTVRSFRKHTLSDSVYDAPGEQDITADVNFTALAAAAREYDIEPLALVTQSQYLVGIGEDTQFADAFQECRLPQEHTKRALQLKHLITPEGMGEAFHVLVMSSRVEKEKAARLSGLKFVRESDRI